MKRSCAAGLFSAPNSSSFWLKTETSSTSHIPWNLPYNFLLIRPYIPSGKFWAIRQSMCPSAGSTNRTEHLIYSDRPARFVRCTAAGRIPMCRESLSGTDMGQEQPLLSGLWHPHHTDGSHHQTMPSLRTGNLSAYLSCCHRLIKKGDSVLLVHARNFRGSFKGLVAGFLEPGETLEECVHREVMEETGIRIKT